MTTQSEYALEDALILQLTGMEYTPVRIENEAEMLTNFKRQLEIHNQNITLTVGEFERVLNHLNTGSVFERAKLLRDRLALKRDNDETLYISFLNCTDWCMNEFQVTHQVTMEGKRKNRYDVTLLINGLPLVKVELKRRGAELKVAFNQINRYQHNSYDAGVGLFQYSNSHYDENLSDFRLRGAIDWASRLIRPAFQHEIEQVLPVIETKVGSQSLHIIKQTFTGR